MSLRPTNQIRPIMNYNEVRIQNLENKLMAVTSEMNGKLDAMRVQINEMTTSNATSMEGQGDAGGWPSTTPNPSGGGRSNNR